MKRKENNFSSYEQIAIVLIIIFIIIVFTFGTTNIFNKKDKINADSTALSINQVVRDTLIIHDGEPTNTVAIQEIEFIKRQLALPNDEKLKFRYYDISGEKPTLENVTFYPNSWVVYIPKNNENYHFSEDIFVITPKYDNVQLFVNGISIDWFF